MFKLYSMIAFITFSLIGLATHAQNVPTTMPYQGFLNNVDGQPVNENVTLTFKLYEEELANQAVWEEVLNNIAVNSGVFSVQLGTISTNLRDYVYTGRAQYVGISINGGPELSPRTKIGTLPYAFFAYNAYKLDGLSASDFVTQETFTNFTQNFQGDGLDADEVNALIDARGYLNTAAINTLIDDRNYLNSDEIDARIANAITEVNNTINTLQTRVTNLETTVNALQTTVNNLQGQEAFILGASNNTSAGFINFGGKQGIEGATEMCKTSYPNDATAHYCSMDEVHRALSTSNHNNNLNANDQTWVYTTEINNDLSTCKSLLYPSAHLGATGTTMSINLNQSVDNGGQGVNISFQSGINCNQARKVLCCR